MGLIPCQGLFRAHGRAGTVFAMAAHEGDRKTVDEREADAGDALMGRAAGRLTGEAGRAAPKIHMEKSAHGPVPSLFSNRQAAVLNSGILADGSSVFCVTAFVSGK